MSRQFTASLDRIAARYERELTLHDPEYNLREAAKQMILLEEHLFQPEKLCPDCVRKHLFTIEALGEEMVSLTNAEFYPHRILRQTGTLFAKLARKWLQEFNDGMKPTEIAEDIRILRKSTIDAVPDPRRDEETYDEEAVDDAALDAAIDRVASLYVFQENLK